MKNFIVIILLFMMFGCAKSYSDRTGYDFITTDFYITDVYKAKYSRVEGYIIYKGFTLHCDNGSSGYYYKDYNLKPGHKIQIDVKICQIPTGKDMLLHVDDIDISKFEKK